MKNLFRQRSWLQKRRNWMFICYNLKSNKANYDDSCICRYLACVLSGWPVINICYRCSIAARDEAVPRDHKTAEMFKCHQLTNNLSFSRWRTQTAERALHTELQLSKVRIDSFCDLKSCHLAFDLLHIYV